MRTHKPTLKVLKHLVLVVCGLCLPATGVFAQEHSSQQTSWQMPDAAKAEWLQTLKMLLPGDGWKLTNAGNEFFIKYAKPVKFYYFAPNSPAGEEPPRIPAEAPFRLTLRFSPLMTSAQYKARQAANNAAEDQNHLQLRKYKINQKYDLYYLSGVDAEQRAQLYRADAAALKHNLLPQFFSLDYSVTAFQSWHFLYHVDHNGQEDLAGDCEETLNRLRRLFGTYEARYAQNSWFAYGEEYRVQPMYPVKLRIFDGKN